MEWRKSIFPILLGLLIVSLVSYGIYVSVSGPNDQEVFLSTTTSVENTGLLDYLIEEYEKKAEYTVKYTAVGSGAAIQLARDGEIDAVIVHAPEMEQELVDDDVSMARNVLWYNYFVIIGPSSDPAGITDTNSAAEAFQNIHDAGNSGEATFYSRGDQSGTHFKELAIWNSTGIEVNAGSDWYFETGTGMSSTLVTADNDPIGYTLTDIGTYATLQGSDTSLDKNILYEEDDLLFNPYSYHLINTNVVGTELNTEGARDFLYFLQLDSTEELVRNYTVGNTVLFNPIEDR